jgi:choline kinase
MGQQVYRKTLRETREGDQLRKSLISRLLEDACMKVLILAAGTNRRFFVDTPKSLEKVRSWRRLPYANMIERNIYLLKKLMVSEILIVVNQHNKRHFEYLCDDKTSLVVNETDVRITGSTISLAIGLEWLEKARAPDGVLVMDADICIDYRALARFVMKDSTTMLVHGRVRQDREEVVVYTNQQNNPCLIGKGLDIRITKALVPIGESTGVIRIAKEDIASVIELCKWMTGHMIERAYGFSAHQSEHEEIWHYLMSAQLIKIETMERDEIYLECDTKEDFQDLESLEIENLELFH